MNKSIRFAVVLAGVGCLAGCSFSSIGGDFRGEPSQMEANVGAGTKMLLAEAFAFDDAGAGDDTETLLLADHHLHAIARGTSAPGRDAYLHPDMNSLLRPLSWLKARVFMSASGVDDYERLDQQYEDRLLRLLLHFQDVQRKYFAGAVEHRFYLYALDYFHDEQGRALPEYTDLYVPDDYVIGLAARMNRVLEQAAAPALDDKSSNRVRVVPVASVHPYRKDFQPRIERLAALGVRHLKWLPPSMGMDLEKVSAHNYRVLAENDVALLVHTGHEYVLRPPDGSYQRLGDPRSLRKALDCGVTAVALHGARRGENPDTGEPYFNDFIELMGMPEYEGLLFGEISVMVMGGLLSGDSRKLMVRVIEGTRPAGALHRRMLNGSDYPVPAIAFFNPTKALAAHAMITDDEQQWLDEIYGYNPLLFDFVLKRTLRHPQTGEKLPDDLFTDLDTRARTAKAGAQDGPVSANGVRSCGPNRPQ